MTIEAIEKRLMVIDNTISILKSETNSSYGKSYNVYTEDTYNVIWDLKDERKKLVFSLIRLKKINKLLLLQK